MNLYPAGKDIVLVVAFDDITGAPIAPSTAQYSVFDTQLATLVGVTPIDVSGGPTSATVTIPAAHNQIPPGELRAMRRVLFEYTGLSGEPHITVVDYIIEALDVIRPGFNAFGTAGELAVAQIDLPELKTLEKRGQNRSRRNAALISAWHNIMALPLDMTALGLNADEKISEQTLARIPAPVRLRLMRAQLTEADSVLGGTPIEDRRRIGMISDSSGESAHFFRTSRPVTLPVSMRTVRELSGLLSWSLRISR